MRRGTILLLLFYLISLAYAAPSLEFQHNDIQPGETIIATISTVGEFQKQIEPSDIKFYKGRKQTSFEYDIKFYNETHYLYIYANREGVFSIEISDILYKEEDMLKSTTINKEFNITSNKIFNEDTNETETQILSIKPGFVFTAQMPIIKIINKGTVVLNLTYGEDKTSLQPLELKEITISPDTTFSYFNISTYKDFSIPVIYLSANSTFQSPSVKSDLRTSPELLFLELVAGENNKSNIELFNFGNETLDNIQITSDQDFIEINEIENISARGVVNLTLSLSPEVPGHFQGSINISYSQNEEQNIISIPLSIFVLPEGSDIETFELLEGTCAELGGNVCESGFICEGNANFTSSQEYCCLGECKVIEDNSSSGGGWGWIIGIIILIGLGAGGYYLYKKQKQVVPKKPEEQMKESSDEYAKRLSGVMKSSRVNGNLTKN
jgi:hypothetical protein